MDSTKLMHLTRHYHVQDVAEITGLSEGILHQMIRNSDLSASCEYGDDPWVPMPELDRLVARHGIATDCSSSVRLTRFF